MNNKDIQRKQAQMNRDLHIVANAIMQEKDKEIESFPQPTFNVSISVVNSDANIPDLVNKLSAKFDSLNNNQQ